MNMCSVSGDLSCTQNCPLILCKVAADTCLENPVSKPTTEGKGTSAALLLMGKHKEGINALGIDIQCKMCTYRD